MKKTILIMCLLVGIFSSCTQNSTKSNSSSETLSPEDKIVEDAIIELCADIDVGSVTKEFKESNVIALHGLIANRPEFKELDNYIMKMYEQKSYEIDKAADENCPVVIKLRASGPSSVNGWDVYPTFTNNSDKEIKYIRFTIIGHNTVGDIIGDKYGSSCKWTGPLAPGKTIRGDGYWTVYLELKMKRDGFEARDIEVEFMDGSTYPDDSNKEIDHKVSERIMDLYVKSRSNKNGLK